MKRTLFIVVGILLLLTAIVLIYFRGDFTADDMNDILAKTASIDICRNMNFDNGKLTSCVGDNNALVISLKKGNDNFTTIKNMYENSREVNMITDALKAKLAYKARYFYKAVFKDDAGNILAGATLGCDKDSFIKVDDTVYKLNYQKSCSDNYDIISSTYLFDNDDGYEEITRRLEEFYRG